MTRLSTFDATAAIALYGLRASLRSPSFILLSILGAVLYHFANVFNITAFQSANLFRREMEYATFWMMAYLFSSALAITVFQRDIVYILGSLSPQALGIVGGKFLGTLGALILALAGQFVLSGVMATIWNPLSALDLVGNLKILVYCAVGSLPVIAWGILLASFLPRAIAGLSMAGLFVIGHGHSAVFQESEAIPSALGLLLPRFELFQAFTSMGTTPPILSSTFLLTGSYAVFHALFLLVLASSCLGRFPSTKLD